MQTIIRPGARDRWTGAVARQFDPQRVETTLRSALNGNLVAQWELFDLMEDTSPRIQKNLNQRKRAVMSFARSVEPWSEEDEAANPEAERRAKVVSSALWKMRPKSDENQNGFDETIYDVLDAVGKGIALLEIDWETRPAGKLGLITAPQCTRWIHPRYYGYPSQGDWLGLNTTEVRNSEFGIRNDSALRTPHSALIADAGTYARIPENKFLVCVCKSKSGHPAGGALLRALAFWWAASNFTQEWFLNLAQVFGLPIRWANYDPNIPGLVDQVADMLENMGSAAWGAFPTGTTIELKDAGKAGQDNPQVALLDRADKQYDLLILGQSGTTEISGPGKSGGSNAANKVLEGVEERLVAADAGYVMRIFNEQLIPMIERLNFGDNTLTPELRLEPRTFEDTKVNADTIKVAVDAGVPVPVDHALKKLGIPKAREGEALLERQAAPDPFGLNPNLNRNLNPPAGDDVAATAHARAQSAATDKLVNTTLENLTGVEARWLGGVKPYFHRLIALAQAEETVSDAEFAAALAKAQREMPELFGKLDASALEDALNDAMSSAVVNGAVRGSMQRRKAVSV